MESGQMKWDKIFSGIFGVCGGVVGTLLGSWDLALQALMTLMIIDYSTGIMCAFQLKCISSRVGFIGIFKKIMIIAVVAVAVILDNILDVNGAIRNIAIFFYIGMEGISILENAARMGVGIPEKLKEALIQLKEGNKKEC